MLDVLFSVLIHSEISIVFRNPLRDINKYIYIIYITTLSRVGESYCAVVFSGGVLVTLSPLLNTL